VDRAAPLVLFAGARTLVVDISDGRFGHRVKCARISCPVSQ
jgi:hypothetical protein